MHKHHIEPMSVMQCRTVTESDTDPPTHQLTVQRKPSDTDINTKHKIKHAIQVDQTHNDNVL